MTRGMSELDKEDYYYLTENLLGLNAHERFTEVARFILYRF